MMSLSGLPPPPAPPLPPTPVPLPVPPPLPVAGPTAKAPVLLAEDVEPPAPVPLGTHTLPCWTVPGPHVIEPFVPSVLLFEPPQPDNKANAIAPANDISIFISSSSNFTLGSGPQHARHVGAIRNEFPPATS